MTNRDVKLAQPTSLNVVSESHYGLKTRRTFPLTKLSTMRYWQVMGG